MCNSLLIGKIAYEYDENVNNGRGKHLGQVVHAEMSNGNLVVAVIKEGCITEWHAYRLKFESHTY